MNNNELNSLLRAARAESPPVPSDDFERDLMRAVRRQTNREPLSLVEQLGELFPRLAWASAAVIVCCAIILSSTDQSSLGDKFAELSQQWLFAAN
jgi:hypothetical protein